MKEFMLHIRNQGDAKAALSAEKHLAFIKECESYIDVLKAENKLIAAQPLVREGVVITQTESGWNEVALNAGNEVQVGYYHIRAEDINEAISIAKQNPEFEYVPTASIEVRPIKTKEQETGFEYPK
ncbi:MAG: hypothetical protein JSS96_13670 [Bacteroidetes bacterium]|nr:hypothetical protein [Bacteroidota bacterium]